MVRHKALHTPEPEKAASVWNPKWRQSDRLTAVFRWRRVGMAIGGRQGPPFPGTRSVGHHANPCRSRLAKKYGYDSW